MAQIILDEGAAAATPAASKVALYAKADGLLYSKDDAGEESQVGFVVPAGVVLGGTGRITGTTAYALVATGTTATGAQQTLASGATTEVLVGGGAAALPVWTTASGSGAPVRATSPSLTTPKIVGGSFAYTLTGGALAADRTLNLPVITATDTLAVLGLAQAWTAAQTYNNSSILLKGSSTGYTTFTSSNAGASNYTCNVPAATTYIPVSTYQLTFSGPTAARTYTFPDASTTVVGTTDTQTLTNKRVTPRVGSTTSSATPTINTDNVDVYKLTAQAVDITSFTTNLSGTPTDGQPLIIQITGTAARAITWGASFEASTVALPTTTVSTDMLSVGFLWNSVTSKWRCVGAV